MHTQMKVQITINASAHKVWQILAHEFDNIGRWAAAIEESSADTNIPAPSGAEVGGRVCSAQGFGDVREEFTYYDESALRFGYKATKGLPAWLVKRAENNWSVHPLGPNKCIVKSRGEIDYTLIPGLFLIPVFKFQMNRIASRLFEELKYYAEQDQPHPRKLKAQQKLLQKNSAPS